MDKNLQNLQQMAARYLNPDVPVMGDYQAPSKVDKVFCYGCGDELYNKKYTKINGHIYCSCCIAEKENEELLKLYGIKLDWEEA